MIYTIRLYTLSYSMYIIGWKVCIWGQLRAVSSWNLRKSCKLHIPVVVAMYPHSTTPVSLSSQNLSLYMYQWSVLMASWRIDIIDMCGREVGAILCCVSKWTTQTDFQFWFQNCYSAILCCVSKWTTQTDFQFWFHKWSSSSFGCRAGDYKLSSGTSIFG